MYPSSAAGDGLAMKQAVNSTAIRRMVQDLRMKNLLIDARSASRLGPAGTDRRHQIKTDGREFLARCNCGKPKKFDDSALRTRGRRSMMPIATTVAIDPRLHVFRPPIRLRARRRRPGREFRGDNALPGNCLPDSMVDRAEARAGCRRRIGISAYRRGAQSRRIRKAESIRRTRAALDLSGACRPRCAFGATGEEAGRNAAN